MRNLFICLSLILSLSSTSTAQTLHPPAEPLVTIEPTVFTENQLSIEDLRGKRQEKKEFSKWVAQKVKKGLRRLEENVKHKKNHIFRKILPHLIQVSTHPWYNMASFKAAEEEKSKDLTIGFWSFLTYLVSMIFFTFNPTLGLITLTAAFILSIIGITLDRDFLAVFTLVLSSITFLFLIMAALWAMVTLTII